MSFIKALVLAVIPLVLSSCGDPLLEKPQPRTQGWDVGNGGSGYAAEFRDIGRTVVRRFQGKGVAEIAGVSIAAFEETLNKAVIETTEEGLKKGNATVDALNFPSQSRI